ncbi:MULTISPECIES: nuclear transport factor 2 family protein [Hymenobacter]|uniref:SnoaL-like domain-containing protein n=1 Tax=Hymenobacter mucosus TaxID=1411120 RepID=A0A239B089_9BACT|nr:MULTISPECIES: nuclear transport factor 2 family protein [Hymenobacter]MDF7815547.1 nuclear transport factor 2 family protein [Hymenobacter sp. YC55]SNS00658.1 SnoaL-like domain-containing protein [Hymenobacter mucosus]
MRAFLAALASLALTAWSVPTLAQTAAAPVAFSTDEAAVRAVLHQYQQAVQKLDTTGTTRLFVPNSVVLESGSREGTYAHYRDHHLGPELKEFNSFTYADYKADVTVDGNYAFATESYTYTIGLKKDPKAKTAPAPIKRRGVASSVLRKNAAGQWQFVSTHNSAHK